MHHHHRTVLGLTLLLVAGAAQTMALPHIMASGGTVAEGANRRLHGTVGQYAIGRFTSVVGGPVTVGGVGFWYLEQAGGSGSPSGTPVPPVGNRLEQNVPNPFNPSTRISFATETAGMVRMRLFNVRGEAVATLINGELPAGKHSLVFSPKALASGVYFYRLETGSFTQTRRMLLLK